VLIGILKETAIHERRVSIVPDGAAALIAKGIEVVIESGAGESAYYPDRAYQDKGARIAATRETVLAADVLATVNLPGVPLADRRAIIERLHPQQIMMGLLNPLGDPKLMDALAARNVTAFALELVPRITRAQSMDALSSMATVAGYSAVLIAARTLPRFFPMLMTAAGTVTPARVFVIGAGVAGLQAIATARRLGAVVHAYDVRPAVKQEVQSLGAKFVELDLETRAAADSGGYARAMDERFYARQRELMSRVLAHSDVVISTAAVPGKKAPVLITRQMVSLMPPGSVIVDLAAEQGGNCEATKPGGTVVERDVTILGPQNLPSSLPYHASQMYSKNITSFLLYVQKELPEEGTGERLVLAEDEIIHDTLVMHGGRIVNARVREALGNSALPAEERQTV
jgi:NAD(P) transhydrogenase subunit alpha